MPVFSSTEPVPQEMQGLIGFAAPPQREARDDTEESFGTELEHAAQA
jgi:hypothetical protein